ncbi:Hypothetical protein POVR2_LOCUS172, partial [uncultured virus]
VHPDLINEPYRKKDSGVRPDVYTTGPYFHYSCKADYHICRIGKTLVSYSSKIKTKSRWKRESTLSLDDVYRTYGLEMVYSYLNHICSMKMSVKQPHILDSYLIGCLYIVQPQLAAYLSRDIAIDPRQRPITVTSLLIAEYQARDAREPRLLAELVAHDTQLPIELLARICNSKRISKAIAAQVTLQRKSRSLRLGELEARAIHPVVHYDSEGESIKSWYIATHSAWWTLKISGSKCNLWSYECHKKLSLPGIPMLYSYRDYGRIEHTNDLDTLQSMLLSWGLNDLENVEYESISCWLMLFVSEVFADQVGRGFECSFDRSQLAAEFQDMLECAVEQLAR